MVRLSVAVRDTRFGRTVHAYPLAGPSVRLSAAMTRTGWQGPRGRSPNGSAWGAFLSSMVQMHPISCLPALGPNPSIERRAKACFAAFSPPLMPNVSVACDNTVGANEHVAGISSITIMIRDDQKGIR